MELEEGRNCWKNPQADRIAFLVDGEEYFRAVAEACEKAEQAIYIIGWDIDSRVRLRRNGDDGESLGRFVDRLAEEKPDLEIYLLDWDFSMLYSFERETWPLFSFGWRTHERVHFELDDKHPAGASQHQKIVVVDDRVAFVGGFDLAICRWDTSEHRPDHPERADNGTRYGPFHDVQMLVDGPAARALGELARWRWEQATGEVLTQPDGTHADPWPHSIEPGLENRDVAILLTIPEYDGNDEAAEIRDFYTNAIGMAKKSIYIENQYFTSHLIGETLEKSLHAEKGPEILLVLPRRCSGWLETQTMGALRERILERLYAADRHQRLRICYPDRKGLGNEPINVHSKVMVVDDEVLTVGSANLSNRSMGFDTECNLALAADDDSARKAIAAFRDRLLAEHLGVDKEELADRIAESGSLLEAVETSNSGERFLVELKPGDNSASPIILSADDIVDPERPISFDRLFRFFDVKARQQSSDDQLRAKAWRFGIVLAAALILAALWRWSPLGEWLDLESILAAAESVRQSPLTLPIILVLYVLASCLMFPITVMILATALTFDAVTGFFLALGGSLLGGLASYLLGHWLGRDVVRKLAGAKVNRLSRKIARRGWLTIAVVRVVPIAPFTIVNMVAGASHVSARAFLVGTAAGMGPGIMAIMLFKGGIERALTSPGWGNFAWAAGTITLGVLVLVLGKRWLTRRKRGHEG